MRPESLPPARQGAGPPTRLRKTGFSLVELLTAIVIVGILTALLIPAFSAAAEETKQAKCRDNLRAQLTGMRRFAEDRFNQPAKPGAPPGSYPYYWYVTTASNDDAPV